MPSKKNKKTKSNKKKQQTPTCIRDHANAAEKRNVTQEHKECVMPSSAAGSCDEFTENLSRAEETKRLREVDKYLNELLDVTKDYSHSAKSAQYRVAYSICFMVLRVLAGESPNSNLGALPAVFKSAHPNILTPTLRSIGEKAMLSFLSCKPPSEEPAFTLPLLVIVESLLKFSPNCTEGKRLAVTRFRAAGRLGDVVEVLNSLVQYTENGEQREKYEQELQATKKELDFINSQLGETELLCPICL